MSWERGWGIGDTRRIATRDFPPGVLVLVEERQGGRWCVACRAMGLTPPEDEPLEVDHKRPLGKGGDNNWTNLQFLCRSHNRAKKDGQLTEPALSNPAWKRRMERPGG